MKKFLSLLLAMILVLSMVACGKSGKGNDADEVSGFKKLYDYLVEEGAESGGDYLLTMNYQSYSMAIIADPAEGSDDEDAISFFVYTDGENGEYSYILEMHDGEKTATVSLLCTVSGSDYYSTAKINIADYDTENGKISSFETDVPSALKDTMQNLLVTHTTLAITYADVILSDTPYSITDLGFKSID